MKVVQLTMPISNPKVLLGILVVLFVLFMVAIVLLSVSLRRYLRRGPEKPRDEMEPMAPRAADEGGQLHASMQSVIQRLKEQEKELEGLHRAEKRRALETEQLSEAVTRNMPTGLLLVNANGLITLANPAAQAALGTATLSYRRYTEALGEGAPLASLLTRCLREGQTFQREEVEHATPEGDVRQLGVTISPVLAPPPHVQGKPLEQATGTIAGALCLLSDLTELTALQKQVRLKESLALLGELSAGVAHEFKNALATISGYAQMLRSEAKTDEQGESAEKIVQETRALTRLVTEFLRFARPMEFVPLKVELRPLVERVVTDLRGEMPGTKIALEGEFGYVAGDDGLLRQALLNLIRNAAQAAAEKSSDVCVTLRGWIEESAQGSVQRVAVRDNGPGIPAADLYKIFLPFYTTKADGTGMGLAVVQKIVVQHGGTVEARNRAEGGAEFLLALPMQQIVSEAVDSASGSI